MAIIYSYPVASTVNNTDTLVISVSDTTADNGFLTKSLTATNLASYVTARVNLNFLGDTGTGIVNLDTQNLTISGTSNEIETSASSQTLQIGLPNNVTITNNLTIGDDLTVGGETQTSTLQVDFDASIDGTLSMEDNINMTQNGRIVNLEDPINAQDAATKQYVDTTDSFLFKKDITITSAQLLSFNGGGSIELIAAPGAGKLIAVQNMIYFLDYNSVAYNFTTPGISDTITFKIGTVNTFQNLSATTDLNLTADKYISFDFPNNDENDDIQPNVAFTLDATAGVTVSQGNSPIKLSILYRNVNLNF